jgi:hypothetical protein
MSDGDDVRVVVSEQREAKLARVDLQLRIRRFNLPPVQSALVMGRRAVIGSKAMSKALDEMIPGAFRRFDVEHPLIEAVIVREAHLRRVPSERLIPIIVKHAEQFMSDADTLHLDIDVEVHITETVEI